MIYLCLPLALLNDYLVSLWLVTLVEKFGIKKQGSVTFLCTSFYVLSGKL